MNGRFAIGFYAICCFATWSITPAIAESALDVLVAAYPDHLTSHDEKDLIWKDGTRLPLSDDRTQKTFAELLDHPSIVDQFAIPYRVGRQPGPPAFNEDPGRIRNEQFFLKMYGDCREREFLKRMRPVAWLPHQGGGTILATTVNGVAEKLEQISAELERLPASSLKYVAPSAGAYNCRKIAASNRISMHSYGAAIDLNPVYGNYWLWNKTAEGRATWKNQIPYDIIEIFERYGFLWGGKWYHFDTLHFEYRPEIINLARMTRPRGLQ
ncbi:MAG: hypothetical protein QOJ84_2663 [Bradyrhizobium sp.]|jgi:hypothetical protein|nr:hypothetical protein [Bradyrhizobium sp.]